MSVGVVFRGHRDLISLCLRSMMSYRTQPTSPLADSEQGGATTIPQIFLLTPKHVTYTYFKIHLMYLCTLMFEKLLA